MKAASVHEIKIELQTLKTAELMNLCLRLAKFKNENKELLTYLLYEAQDERAFIHAAKIEMDNFFENMNVSGVYLAKKTLRKILRIIGKYIRFSSSAAVEIELLIHFCALLIQSGLPIRTNQVLLNMYQAQIKKIKKTIEGLHEDLQYDYHRMLSAVMDF